MLELRMPTPADEPVRRALIFNPDFHDVDELLQRVTPAILPWQQLNEIGAAIQRSVQVSDALERYALDLWQATHEPKRFDVRIEEVDVSKLILAGVSPRGMMALIRAARVVAWLAGRTHLVPADIHAVAREALGHRIFFTPIYELRRAQIADELIAQILERVATPR
jgi:MoxR-like ATPase